MFGNILFRMIFWELTKVFVVALAGITGIMLMAGLIAEATQQGLGPRQVLGVIPLLIPSMLPYTIPATTLFAACVVYGRLAADNEILAIKAAGVNLVHVAKPGLMLGLAMTAITMGLYFQLIPYTHHLLRSAIFADAEEMIYASLRRNGTINQPELAYAMFVRGMNGRCLHETLFKRRDAKGHMNLVAQAREAELHVDRDRQQIQVHMHFGVATTGDGSQAAFVDKVWEVPLPDKYGAEAKKRPRAMSWLELLQRRRTLRGQVKETRGKIADVEAEMRTFTQPPESFTRHYQNLKTRKRAFEMRIVELEVELLMRPALALGCFCFVLVGCPVGIWFSRSDFLSAFITCFVPICFVYYPLMLCGTNMAKDGKFTPWVLVSLADLCMGIVGVGLFTKLVRN